jgi:hypothetical protein
LSNFADCYNSITPPNLTIYIIYLTILKSFYYYWALVSNLNWNNVLFVTDSQKLWLSLIGYDKIQIQYQDQSWKFADG